MKKMRVVRKSYTFKEILTSNWVDEEKCQQLIQRFAAFGGEYSVANDQDVNWVQNSRGMRFRRLDVARAATYYMHNPHMHVVGPDATCYDGELPEKVS